MRCALKGDAGGATGAAGGWNAVESSESMYSSGCTGGHAASHSDSAAGSSEPSEVDESGACGGLSGPKRRARMGGCAPAGAWAAPLAVPLANGSPPLAAENVAPQLSHTCAPSRSVAPH
jgi:hypothetical protein